ncbi:MAG: type II toxin-antitoxin system Phd/YefM family antitoxin [Taibaiella sp.]|nr:type II toxin-antitoxin system Phd/YefM family antitoxin [Taibaiella sp.]
MPQLVNQNTIDMMDLRSQPGTVIDNVFYRNTSFVIKRSGKARAVIVPLREYEDMQRRRKEAKERFFAMTEELQARFAKEDPKKVQQMIDEAIEAIRREKKPSDVAS